jgi:hypothetical protein
LYLENGDGSLFAVGLAGPNDYDRNGVRTGQHHPNSQPNTPYQGQPSPQQQTQNPVTGSPQSLLAKKAQTYNA